MYAPWKKSYDQPRQHITKQRYYFADESPSSQGYGFSSGHVGMWELDYQESWVMKNWCFWTVVLEKTLESPLDCKEIKIANPEGVSESHSVVFDCLWSLSLYSPWNSPGQNTELGSLSLLQGIFPTQGSNPGILSCRWILYQLSHKGRPMEITPEYSLEGLMLKLKLQYFGHLMWRADSLEKTLMLGKIEGKMKGSISGWDGWMASPTQWTWVWVSSRSWWWTGMPGILQYLVSLTKSKTWLTELSWIFPKGEP